MAKRFRTISISNPEYQPDYLTYITVNSRYLKGRGDCTVFVPPQVEKITPDIPVVILLHGVYASHWAWTSSINVHRLALKLIEEGVVRPMVLVMPSDGLHGDGSGYFNHGEKNFEQWIIRDVVDLIPAAVPQEGKLSLFIAGLSMGGYGALRLAAKYPKRFKGASGLSSITSLNDLLPFLAPSERLYFKAKFKSEELISYFKKNKKLLPPFRFDCGSSDPLISSNQKLHEKLLKEGIPHTLDVFEGDHSNVYWNKNIVTTLSFFDGLMKNV